MILSIHQPEHIPWLGFFHKMSHSEQFLILDTVPFSKNYYQNRNKIRTSNGSQWLTVPVHKNINTLIKDVTIANDPKWKKKWKDSIYFSYKKSKFFNQYSEVIIDSINNDWEYLSELNMDLILKISNILKIETKIIRASSLPDMNAQKSQLLLSYCKYLNTDIYFSGISGKEYLDLDFFSSNDIQVEFQTFYHPIYQQTYEPFIPCMSVLDLIFNHGEASIDIINGKGVSVMNKVFT